MTVTDDEIRTALARLADIIKNDKRYGSNAWPIFERLERELAVREDRETRLQKALTYKDRC